MCGIIKGIAMNWMKNFWERILKNKVFWGCVLCVTALSFTAVCYVNETGKEYSFWDLFFEGKIRQIFLENDITLESLIANPISIFMAMFMPILVIFPFLNVFWNEKMTNNYLFRQARIGIRKYIVGSMADAVFSSGLLAVLGRFLHDGILFLIFTSIGKKPVLSQMAPLLLMKGVHFFFYGCLVCIPVLFFIALLKNRYIILCMPFILIYLYDLLLRNRNMAIWETTGILYYPWKEYLQTAGVWMMAAVLVLMIGCYGLIKRRVLHGTW